MFQLHGVSKSYGTHAALAPTDLVIEPNRTTVLIGPSGCGKSTLLRLLIGLVAPDAGTIEFAGAPVMAAGLEQLRRRMGYVIQDGGLFPHLTARRNATLMARHVGRSAKECQARIEELAALTQLPGDALDRYPAELSGGQRQRVSLMRALFLDPDVLLLDEPLGALDPMIRSGLQSELKQIFGQLSKTVILVTHDIGEAGFLGDVILLMRDGRIVQQGPLADLLHRPADPFVTEFINAQRSPLESLERELP